jgi:hypothetical protein
MQGVQDREDCVKRLKRGYLLREDSPLLDDAVVCLHEKGDLSIGLLQKSMVVKPREAELLAKSLVKHGYAKTYPGNRQRTIVTLL